jgi:hypothetical protein
MPAANSPGSLDAATRGFRDLALRRHAYYLDLLKSGRWRHYFSEQEFAERLRDVMTVTRAWNGLAKASDKASDPRPTPIQSAKSAA